MLLLLKAAKFLTALNVLNHICLRRAQHRIFYISEAIEPQFLLSYTCYCLVAKTIPHFTLLLSAYF